MIEIQLEKILEELKNSTFSNYYISKKTGISQSSIANWKKGITVPNPANGIILEQLFRTEERQKSKKISFSGNDLRQKLSELNITLKYLAQALHISEQSLQYHLSLPDVKVSFLMEIAAALHTSVYYFFENNSSHTPTATPKSTTDYCKLCEEKERVIASLKASIQYLQDHIQSLKKE